MGFQKFSIRPSANIKVLFDQRSPSGGQGAKLLTGGRGLTRG